MHGGGHGFSPFLGAFLGERVIFYLKVNFVSSLFRIPLLAVGGQQEALRNQSLS